MRVVILYRPASDHSRLVDEFVSNINTTSINGSTELINVDTKEGSSKAALYDIISYPAVFVLRDDGVLQHLWQGLPLPLVNEVEAYFRA